MQHTLPSCQTALTQGRYRWRHDTVLKDLADILEWERRKTRPTNNLIRQGRTNCQEDKNHSNSYP
ncbi:hypothetical protein DPMN_129114 [Dreissena polymorpha]|uniref:Uncharacterized protein n=1 Tax=Dreissena polymorpha TaxID=45954 RepID=A0A9D4H0M4_DREPO|nr:hypothetical protein DPMN_129114 [Dreissena polymorpha]